MRNSRGLSTVETLIALLILASLGALTGPVLQAMADRQEAIARRQFAMFVDRFVSTAAARIKHDTNFTPTSLNLSNVPLSPGSRYTGSATFQGCLTGNAIPVAHNNLTAIDIEFLKISMVVRTPASVISAGYGQTGGIVLNEVFDKSLGDKPTILVYRLTEPTGKQATAELLGDSALCP